MASAPCLAAAAQHHLVPAAAATSAMPEPMIPEPTIPTRVIDMGAKLTGAVTTGVEAGGSPPRACKSGAMDTSGTLALVGGNEWTEGCTFDATLLADSGGTDVLVLPTAAAYQHPERVVLRAAEWFEPLGGQVEGLMVVDRASAEDAGMAAVVARARFIYLAGGSPLHLRAVLEEVRRLRRRSVRPVRPARWWPGPGRAPWC